MGPAHFTASQIFFFCMLFFLRPEILRGKQKPGELQKKKKKKGSVRTELRRGRKGPKRFPGLAFSFWPVFLASFECAFG